MSCLWPNLPILTSQAPSRVVFDGTVYPVPVNFYAGAVARIVNRFDLGDPILPEVSTFTFTELHEWFHSRLSGETDSLTTSTAEMIFPPWQPDRPGILQAVMLNDAVAQVQSLTPQFGIGIPLRQPLIVSYTVKPSWLEVEAQAKDSFLCFLREQARRARAMLARAYCEWVRIVLRLMDKPAHFGAELEIPGTLLANGDSTEVLSPLAGEIPFARWGRRPDSEEWQ